MGWNGLKWVKMGWNGLRWVKMACVGLRGLSISLSEFQSSRSEFAGENLVILFPFFQGWTRGFRWGWSPLDCAGFDERWRRPGQGERLHLAPARVSQKKIKSNQKAKHILPSKRKPSNNSVTRTQPIVAGHGKGAKKTKGFGYHRRRLAVDGRPMSARAVCRRIDFGRLLPFFVLFRRFSFLSLVLFPFRRPTMKPEKNSNPIWKIKKKYAIITKTIDITRQNSVKPCKTMKKSCQTQRNPMKPSQFRLNPVKPNKTQ